MKELQELRELSEVGMIGEKGACGEIPRYEARQLGHRKWRALPTSCLNMCGKNQS